MKTGSENIFVITQENQEICETSLKRVNVKTKVDYSGGTITAPPSTIRHNELNGLQGGSANERYHLSKAQLDSLSNMSGGSLPVKVYNDELLNGEYTDVNTPDFFELYLSGSGLLRRDLDYTKNENGFTLFDHIKLTAIDFLLIEAVNDDNPQTLPTSQKITVTFGDNQTFPGSGPGDPNSILRITRDSESSSFVTLSLNSTYVYQRPYGEVLKFTYQTPSDVTMLLSVNDNSSYRLMHYSEYILTNMPNFTDKVINVKTEGGG